MVPRTSAHLARLSRIAEEYGVTLPGPVAAALDAPALLDVTVGDATREAALALVAAEALPTQSEREEAARAALDDLARASAAQDVRSRYTAERTRHRYTVALEHASEIVSGFADALAGDLAALNTHAADVPLGVSPDEMNPGQFRAYFESSRALARAEEVRSAVAFVAPVPPDREDLGEAEWSRLGLLDLTDADPAAMLLALRDAMPATVGSFKGKAAPWHLAAARAGARFVLADVALREANVEVIDRVRILARQARDKGPRVLVF